MKFLPPILAALAITQASALEKFTYDDNPNGVQVFILAGQSNMVGHGKAEDGHGDVKGAIGSLRHLVVNDTAKYAHLLEDPENPATSPWKSLYNVKVWWRDSGLAQPRAVLKGDLNIGFSQNRNKGWFGPEYGFGWVMGQHFPDKPVLIIKVAWGGKSLHTEFRPPSAVAARGGEVGNFYNGLINYVRDCLSNIDTEFPELAGMGYRIRGFGWHQGFPDRVKQDSAQEYEQNLVDLITDLRAEFGNPKLPFSITTTGMDPSPEYSPVELAQLAVADPKKYPQFADNVRTTDTRPFWRTADVSPSNLGYHWNHNGESQFLNGTAMGKTMVEILEKP
jgi:alpha-galactosidase